MLFSDVNERQLTTLKTFIRNKSNTSTIKTSHQNLFCPTAAERGQIVGKNRMRRT